MSEKKLDCDIVRDLLPLYHDKVVSDTTSIAVEEHLSDCEECSNEYYTISTELETKLDSEKKGIKELLTSIKHKGLIKGIIIAVICVAVMISSLYVLTQVPLKDVPENNLSVSHVYKYKGTFFVFYEQKIAIRTLGKEVESDNGKTLNINLKQPIIDFKPFWTDEEKNNIIETQWETENKYTNVTKLTLNGKVIWTEQENGNDEIPDYVREFVDSFENDAHGGISTWSYDENKISVIYGDGSIKVWDLDGNVIDEHNTVN